MTKTAPCPRCSVHTGDGSLCDVCYMDHEPIQVDGPTANTDKPWPECFDVILGESGDVGSTRLVRKADFDAMMEGSAEWEDEARIAKLEVKALEMALATMGVDYGAEIKRLREALEKIKNAMATNADVLRTMAEQSLSLKDTGR